MNSDVERDRADGGGSGQGSPAAPVAPVAPDRTLYRVRVPVVFDHLNAELRDELDRSKVGLLQVLGRGAAFVDDDSVRFGKFEIWFELNDDPPPDGQRHAADQAISTVQRALEQVGLAPTRDERGLGIVERQVITTALVAKREVQRP